MAKSLARRQRYREQEFIIERPDGVRFACSESVEPQYDEEGNLRGAVAVVQDISERKRTEELLRRQADLLAQTQDAIFAWHWDGTIVFWNRGAERLYGFSTTEALGRKSYELLKLEKPRDFDQLRYQLSRDGQSVEEVVQFARDGRRVLVESRLVLSRSFDSHPVVLETNRDISERKQIEIALSESEERLRLAVDAGQIGTWDWDIARDQITWSKHVYEVHGLNPENFDGRLQSFEKIVHEEDRPRVAAAIKGAIESGTPYSIEMRVVRPNGELRWVFANGQVFYDSARKPVRMLGATVDITDRKRAEEKLEHAVRERTARLRETVGELEAFSYSVSHDLRAPLRAMHGYSVALLEEAAPQLTSEQRDYLYRISRASQRLDLLINDVLTYSRLSRAEVRFDPIDLDRVVREIIQQYPSLQSDRTEIQIGSPLGRVLGHEAMIVQAVSNLLINAAKFVRPGVRPKIIIRSENRDEWLRLWIEDNGIGIAPHNQARIFGMFQRLNPDSQYEGTGIGLSIVKKAIERLNGRLGVESEEGRGTRFWIELKRN